MAKWPGPTRPYRAPSTPVRANPPSPSSEIERQVVDYVGSESGRHSRRANSRERPASIASTRESPFPQFLAAQAHFPLLEAGHEHRDRTVIECPGPRLQVRRQLVPAQRAGEISLCHIRILACHEFASVFVDEDGVSYSTNVRPQLFTNT